MPQRIDGWTLMARIAAHPQNFDRCDTIAALAALLVLRSQLTQGVTSEGALAQLAAIVGQNPMIEIIENLAGYEALRIVINIDGADASGERRSPDAARHRLIDIVTGDHSRAAPKAAPPPDLAPPASGFSATRPLRRHNAMGARRIRNG